MKVELVKSDFMDDWYTIEAADVPEAFALRPVTGGGLALWSARRVSDACVEGTAEEMRDIAAAIRSRSYVGHKRCAVAWTEAGECQLWSPRNSQTRGTVSADEADALASQIEAEVSR